MVATLSASLREQLWRERERATRDELTGLSNRRHFLEAGSLEVERSNRQASPLTVLFLDLDHFKQLNDSQGHVAGDLALKTVALALLRSTRITDLVARLGGDEFAVILAQAERGASEQAAHRLTRAVNVAAGAFPGLSVSVGMACFDSPVPPVGDMLRAADTLMYGAKQAGGGTLVAKSFPPCWREAG